MGIKDLKPLIRKHSPNGVTVKQLNNYSNKIVAIDISIYLYRFLSFGNHLSGLVRQILLLLENDITPIYVFDGKPPDAKNDVIKERKEKKNKLMEKKIALEKQIAEATNEVQIKNFKKLLFLVDKELICITSEHLESSKELFRLFGIPYLVANGEAEILCAKLCQMKYVDACLSEDTDLLPNGSNIFINNFKVNQNYVLEFNLEQILSDMSLTHEQFVDLCILCGCDYTTKITGLAKDGAYTLIRKYKTIEGIIDYINNNKCKYQVPDNFNYQKAREIFNTSLEELIDPKMIRNKLVEPKVELLEGFITSKCDRLAKKYFNLLRKVLAKKNPSIPIKSTTIDCYFSKA